MKQFAYPRKVNAAITKHITKCLQQRIASDNCDFHFAPVTDKTEAGVQSFLLPERYIIHRT